MSTVPSVEDVNRELGRQINEEALADPKSPYRGKFVGIANGQVVVVGDDLTETVEALRRVDPDSTRLYCLEAGRPEEVMEVWETT
jgi:hypothetical protein